MINYLDTNVLLRFLVKDNQEQYQQAVSWFQEAQEGKITLHVHPLVIAEACFVLESFYHRSRTDIAKALKVFVSQKWLKVTDRQALQSLWPWYLKNLHFVDSFLLALSAQKPGQVLTYDRQVAKESDEIVREFLLSSTNPSTD